MFLTRYPRPFLRFSTTSAKAPRIRGFVLGQSVGSVKASWDFGIGTHARQSHAQPTRPILQMNVPIACEIR